MALTLGVFGVVVWMTARVANFVLDKRSKITCMVGMMVAMTMGMMAGLAVGTALGVLYRQDLFTSTVISMVVGVAAGVVTGLPVGTMAVMDGIMAGIMGGMMGAMLGQMMLFNRPTLITLIMLECFMVVVWLLQRMLHEETGVTKTREVSDDAVVKGINTAILGASAIIIVVLAGSTFSGRQAEVSASPLAENVASAQPAESGPAPSGPVQEVRITVGEGTYTPEQVVLQKGVPVRLTLVKNYSGGCQSIFVAPDFRVQTYVKPGTTTVEFTPTRAGEFPFSCGMGMFGGTFIVKG